MYVIYSWLFAFTGPLGRGGGVPPLLNPITHGILAAFTFISGYFLGGKNIKNFKDILMFYFRRLVSFYPLYVLACILFLYIGCIKSWHLCIMTMMGLSGVLSAPVLTLWYLCMLMFFYFITPIINMITDIKVKCMLIVTIFAVLLSLSNIAGGVNNRYPFYWVFYGAGILWSGKLSKRVNYVTSFLSIIFFYLASIKIEKEYSFISAACFVIFILNSGKILEKTFVLPLLKKASYASMCAYLFHRPIYWLIRGVSEHCLGKFTLWQAYLVALPIMLLSAYTIQYIYDRTVKQRLYIAISKRNAAKMKSVS